MAMPKTMMEEVRPLKIFIGKLPHGSDLLDEITTLCEGNDIRLGRIEAIGAVQSARLAYYDQEKKEYTYFSLEEHLEIASLVGNISMKDGRPMVHAHISLSAGDGRAFGGHLAQGTRIFACEYTLEVFQGPELERVYDEITGLPLWKDLQT